MKRTLLLLVLACLAALPLRAQSFKLNDAGYFNDGGVDVMAFSDYYPEGHQGGISVIMNARRILTNGDLRFEPTPGQWQPVPKQLKREALGGKIVTRLAYPDSSRHLTGFNPMVYPDIQMTYSVTLEPYEKGLMVTVDLDNPIPEEFLGKVGFNLEMFPGYLFGQPWIMDGQTGIFPQQPNAPLELRESTSAQSGDFHPAGRPLASAERLNRDPNGYTPLFADDVVAAPYAQGKVFTVLPDDPYSRIKITSLTGEMKLYDGRMNHNNGWFVLRGEVAKGATKGAIRWIIEPNVVPSWRYPAVVQTSQVGYHSRQPKVAVLELDKRAVPVTAAQLVRITENGERVVKNIETTPWEGNFLRYQYRKADFSDVTEPGLYKVRYDGSESTLFRIADDVYDRGVWQPVLEYFLPVQMCHMRVSEKYRVWHDYCHMDDALMAEEGNHIDGYTQRAGVPGKLEAGEIAHGLNVGGWHDAGDFDLRIPSQAGESYILALTWEAFHPDIDATDINFVTHNVEIHRPDGRNDLLQQVENGALSVVGGYLALGRLYRGIIANSLRQYVLLGDAAAMTDGIPGNEDDRWVFTEVNPSQDLSSAAALAATARVLRGHNDTLAVHCEAIAREIFATTAGEGRLLGGKLQAATELWLATGENQYSDFLLANWDYITANIARTGWYSARFAKSLEGQKKYRKQVEAYRAALQGYAGTLAEQAKASPYGVPYRPDIWGAGWTIQTFGYNYWFLADAYPDIFPAETVYNALNFVLGCHPGTNQQSFASGVGTASATVGYGLNRADWSYIPGGVVSGTALIRPDFPELLVFPYLWQQVEYVLGGGSSHYMFLVLAAQHMLNN